MNTTDNRLNEFLAKGIAENVDELGRLIQKIMIESYMQGHNDALSDSLQSKARVLAYRNKITGMDYYRGRDGQYYPTESGDLAGLEKDYFLPSEYIISAIVTDKNVVKELDTYGTYEGVVYQIHSFAEKADGEILVGLGPTLGEFLDELNTKKHIVVNVNKLD